MKRWTRTWLSVGCALVAAQFGSACGGSTSETLGGETHWLSVCQDKADCDSGQECLCGVCTIACDSGPTCGEVGEPAECRIGIEADGLGTCEDGSPRALCLRPLDTLLGDATECGDEEILVMGACLTCGERLAAEDAALDALLSSPRYVACAEDMDCTRASISTDCWSRCGAGVAVGAAQDFEDAVRLVERAYCPPSRDVDVCAPGLEDCTESVPRCDDGACVLAEPGDSPGMCASGEVLVDGDCMTCEQRSDAERVMVDELLADSAFDVCQEDSDCVQTSASTECSERCPTTVAASQLDAYADALSSINTLFCLAPGAPAACSGSTEDCELRGLVPRCEAGACVWGGRDIEGYPVDEERGCLGELQVAGTAQCAENDGGVTYAVDPDGACWMMPTTCIPDGFEEAGADAVCREVTETCGAACAARTEGECESDARCRARTGQPASVDATCYRADPVYAGCIPVDLGCAEAEVDTVAPDGSCWHFSDYCFPEGHLVAQDGQCPVVVCE